MHQLHRFGLYGGQGNRDGTTFVAYCFADIEGHSKAFSYTGNGNADGTYVSLGFRPQFIIVKRTDSFMNSLAFWLIIKEMVLM